VNQFDHAAVFHSKEYVMSIKAVVTTLILGSSSVVLAAPAARDHRVERAPVRTVQPQRSFEHRDFGGRPGLERGHGRFEAPVVRDNDRFERERFERPIIRDRWVRPYYYEEPTVYVAPQVYTAPMTPFINGAMSISLGGAAGTGIELSANGGATYVQQVVITYTDGRTQVAQIGQELDSGNPVLDLGTDGTPVASVTVYGNGSGVSAYAI
jgi:hypothetical protein